MNTNFDFLKQYKEFDSFADQAIEAEQGLSLSASTSAILTRRALELAVRWVFVNDAVLRLPYRDNLSALLQERTFQTVLEPGMLPLLRYIVSLGNQAVHSNQRIKRDDAILALRDLFEFCKWIEYCYAPEYVEAEFVEAILASDISERRETQEELQNLYDQLSSKDRSLEAMRKENEELRLQMTASRESHTENRSFRIDQNTEAETRRKYIDISLMEVGWHIGSADCQVEFPVTGMPSDTGRGRVDYVLFGDNGRPLAVVEAKKSSVDPIVGSQQAKLYADCLQNQFGQRPVIFTTNGFEHWFTDDYNDEPKRRVSGFFTQEELQLSIDRRKSRKPLDHVYIRDDIAGRPYQKEAVLAVCDAIRKKQRKMLLVQATGSGKTRVSISIVDVLRRHNYVKNVLFLADRTALVKQAKNSYSNLLPDLTMCNLLDSKDDPEQSRMIFSTYPTMMNAIDGTRRASGEKLFSPGHFDLIIVDESHRSIYKKYQDIFNYFDAMLLGMTATPKNEIDKNTYGIFNLERGVPTFAYDLEQAVKEGYLVDYKTLEYKTKIMEEGIHYDDLSEEEKDEFDETFEDDPRVDKDISNTAINRWLFNADTIDTVLKELIEHGLKLEGGDKLGKTIIFARNSTHAAAIVERFHLLFPEYGNSFIKQIDYSINYVDSLIDDFSVKEKMPQIAVSVDMLDTGIDIPEILNLVFFKKVRSYSKFWQMIGRGTRLCKNLYSEGQDKRGFLIFDFCGNFDFFRVRTSGYESKVEASLTEKLFNCRAGLIRELQAQCYQEDEEYAAYRSDLIDRLHHLVVELNDESFRVKQHYRYVEYYRSKLSWQNLETIGVSDLREHIAPLIMPEKDDELARRFDYLIYSIQLADLQSRNASKMKNIVKSAAEKLSNLYSIPQVKAERDTIERVCEPVFFEQATILDLDSVREALRDLLQFIERAYLPPRFTDFEETILEEKEGESIQNSDDFQNYRKKVEFYLKEHRDNLAVYKLRQNKKMTKTDLKELERILWKELGSREDYEKEYGDTPIGRLVRRIVGVDADAVNQAFSDFLSNEQLNVNQLRFVKMIIDYIVKNGNIEDNSVLMDEPFRSAGSIMTLFKDDMGTAVQLKDIIEEIRRNSEETA